MLTLLAGQGSVQVLKAAIAPVIAWQASKHEASTVTRFGGLRPGVSTPAALAGPEFGFAKLSSRAVGDPVDGRSVKDGM